MSVLTRSGRRASDVAAIVPIYQAAVMAVMGLPAQSDVTRHRRMMILSSMIGEAANRTFGVDIEGEALAALDADLVRFFEGRAAG
jgi:hypothetical protein